MDFNMFSSVLPTPAQAAGDIRPLDFCSSSESKGELVGAFAALADFRGAVVLSLCFEINLNNPE
jgi:hypothetical protein